MLDGTIPTDVSKLSEAIHHSKSLWNFSEAFYADLKESYGENPAYDIISPEQSQEIRYFGLETVEILKMFHEITLARLQKTAESIDDPERREIADTGVVQADTITTLIEAYLLDSAPLFYRWLERVVVAANMVDKEQELMDEIFEAEVAADIDYLMEALGMTEEPS